MSSRVIDVALLMSARCASVRVSLAPARRASADKEGELRRTLEPDVALVALVDPRREIF